MLLKKNENEIMCDLEQNKGNSGRARDNEKKVLGHVSCQLPVYLINFLIDLLIENRSG